MAGTEALLAFERHADGTLSRATATWPENIVVTDALLADADGQCLEVSGDRCRFRVREGEAVYVEQGRDLLRAVRHYARLYVIEHRNGRH